MTRTWAGLTLDRPHTMGIVNVTPDSFSDGARFDDAEAAIMHGLQMAEAGASILDVGGESTRPGATPISIEEELERVLPVVQGLVAGLAGGSTLVSVDTRNPEVMRAVADAGADIINDVSGFTHSPESMATAAELGLPVVVMHMQGTPETMQQNPTYDDVVTDISDWLDQQAQALIDAGLAAELIAVDPGIGFGKTLDHNLALLANWSRFETRFPSLLGASRKGFIRKISGETDATKRVPGSLAAAIAAYHHGCRLFRVHDVAETAQALAVTEAIETRTPQFR